MSDERDLSCAKCNYDLHDCPGCGDSVPHGTAVCASCLADDPWLEQQAGAYE